MNLELAEESNDFHHGCFLTESYPNLPGFRYSAGTLRFFWAGGSVGSVSGSSRRGLECCHLIE